MTQRKPSKDDALEALDFIINVLKEHEKDLTELIKFLSIPGEKPPAALVQAQTQAKAKNAQQTEAQAKTETAQTAFMRGPPVIVRCRQWEDFKLLAQDADTVSFLYKDAEKNFQADALKDGRVLTFNGSLPEGAKLLKAWLARELSTAEARIFEGVLAIG